MLLTVTRTYNRFNRKLPIVIVLLETRVTSQKVTGLQLFTTVVNSHQDI